MSDLCRLLERCSGLYSTLQPTENPDLYTPPNDVAKEKQEKHQNVPQNYRLITRLMVSLTSPSTMLFRVFCGMIIPEEEFFFSPTTVKTPAPPSFMKYLPDIHDMFKKELLRYMEDKNLRFFSKVTQITSGELLAGIKKALYGEFFQLFIRSCWPFCGKVIYLMTETRIIIDHHAPNLKRSKSHAIYEDKNTKPVPNKA